MTTNKEEKKTFIVYRVITSQAEVEATSLQQARDIAADLAEEDFTQTGVRENVEELS